MIRMMSALVALFVVAGCGGGSRFDGNMRGAVLYATGPIQNACLAGGRKGASGARCGCIQAVADRSLSNADQRRGARYFKDPGELQEVRQSSRASDERFWRAWKAFGEQAQVCEAA